jgi:hypothetical protein
VHVPYLQYQSPAMSLETCSIGVYRATLPLNTTYTATSLQTFHSFIYFSVLCAICILKTTDIVVQRVDRLVLRATGVLFY